MGPLAFRPAPPRRRAAALLGVAVSVLVTSPMQAQRSTAHHASGARTASSVAAGHGRASDDAAARRGFVVRGAVDGEDIVRAARRFIGVRYRLGADSPTALDCSSFVRRVFAEYGVAMPRTAHEQAAVGDAPPPGDLRAGDLLFFYGGHGAQHIAIYVGGDTIIHASSRGRRVQLDRLSGRGHRRSWFNERLIAVRRVAPVEGVFRLDAPSTPPPPRQASADDGGTNARTLTASITRLSPKS
jgi:cell wall-associated NlpC family hydrolase